MSKKLTIIRPDDWHLHVRDGAVLKDVLAHTTKQFARAVIMPNLKPPVTTVDLATHRYCVTAVRSIELQSIDDTVFDR
ncbi:MAG: hypothetical protein RL082_37 [Pseudomonadota bacterium]